MDATTLNRDDLESMVDRWGLAGVLEALSEISQEKARHIDETWQDGGLARDWRRAAVALDRASRGKAVTVSAAIRIWNHGR